MSYLRARLRVQLEIGQLYNVTSSVSRITSSLTILTEAAFSLRTLKPLSNAVDVVNNRQSGPAAYSPKDPCWKDPDSIADPGLQLSQPSLIPAFQISCFLHCPWPTGCSHVQVSLCLHCLSKSPPGIWWLVYEAVRLCWDQ